MCFCVCLSFCLCVFVCFCVFLCVCESFWVCTSPCLVEHFSLCVIFFFFLYPAPSRLQEGPLFPTSCLSFPLEINPWSWIEHFLGETTLQIQQEFTHISHTWALFDPFEWSSNPLTSSSLPTRAGICPSAPSAPSAIGISPSDGALGRACEYKCEAELEEGGKLLRPASSGCA